MTEHQHHHPHQHHDEETTSATTRNINEGSSLGELIKKTNGDNNKEALPFLDKLMENPVEFMPSHVLEAVSDGNTTNEPVINKEQEATMVKDMKKNSFCNNMMSQMGSGHHEMMMAHHGVGPMTVGGGMSGGMVMYMDGFRFAMTGNQPCLNLYFPSWTLDTKWKFIAALICVFSLSFATEAVSKFRHNLSKNNRLFGGGGRRRQQQQYQPTRRTRQMLISGLHGIQALLGYVVMLATMTFSLEILLSVVLGLSTGYYYYFAGEIGLEGHVTTNPCCSYMQDESNEHEQRQQNQQQEQATLDAAAVAAAAAAAASASSIDAQPPCCNEESAETTTNLLTTSDPTEV